MSPILILVILAIFLIGLAAWNGQSKSNQNWFQSAFEENLGVVLVLLALILIPAFLLLPLPDFLPQQAILVVGLGVWGILTSTYWTRITPLPVPPRPHPVIPPEPVDETSDGEVTKTFHWTFTDRHGISHPLALNLSINQARYQQAKNQPRLPIRSWAEYVLTDMPELDELSAAFAHLLQDKDWSSLDRASVVLCFTQLCIRYVSDLESTGAQDWPRYPIETLMDEVGDCEDDAILACAVLNRLGFEVALLVYPEHCALGVAGAQGLPGHFIHDPNSGLDYFYGETTAEGWRLGELPEMLRGAQPEMILPVKRLVE